ncbi:50S ribosomal protein L34 [Abeliophyllum distichum]|uniref:Large ribosomal subunit protein bL34c n=1 Tax=Abeliophyllum distichum TaxID=126358 RepID=A0ABD1QHI1_9LAMI
MASILSMGTMICYKGNDFNGPSASLSLLAGSRTRASVSLKPSTSSSGLRFHCSFTPFSSLSLSSSSSFSGSSLGLDLNTNICVRLDKRRGLVVRAKKYALCQTKRNRSRKSLARTHGFRLRMSTTSGRAVIKHRRAKGRLVLCTKTNPSTGKRV